MKLNRHNLIAIAILCVATAFSLYPIFLGRFWAIGDMNDVYIPLEKFFQHEQLSSRLPLWNPNISWGYPAIAAAQIGFYYPPLLLGRLLPIVFYLPFLIVLHLTALAIGTFWLAKQYRYSSQAATLSALAISLSAFVSQHLTHLNIFLALAWLPWQWLAIRRTISSVTPRRDYTLVALTFGLPFLIGQIQTPLFMAIISTCYIFSLNDKKIRQTILHLIPTAALVILLTLAQLLPTAELALNSARGPNGTYDTQQANQHSFPLYHIPTLIFPRFFGVDNTYWGKRLEIEYGIFFGTLPLLLAFFAIYQEPKRNRFLLALLVISFLLALGSLSPFRLLGLEPSLWLFSAPARWLIFTVFSAALLAGRGLDLIQTKRHAFVTGLIWSTAIILITVALSNLAIWLFSHLQPNQIVDFLTTHTTFIQAPKEYYQQKITTLQYSFTHSSVSFKSPYTWLPLAVLVVTILLRRTRYLRQIVLGLTFCELIIVAATTTPTLTWSEILTPPKTVAALPDNVRSGQARLLTYANPGDTGKFLTNPNTRPNQTQRLQRNHLLVPLIHTLYNLPGTQWPASLPLQTQQATHTLLQNSQGQYLANYQQAQNLNIGAFLVPADVTHQAPTVPVKQIDNILIYSLNPTPRVTLKTNDQITPLQYNATNPRLLSWQVSSSQTGQLIVRDTYYKGWTAFIDNQPVPIEQEPPFFRRITVPAGQHQITMRYDAPLAYLGMWLSSVGGLLALVLLIIPVPHRIDSTIKL